MALNQQKWLEFLEDMIDRRGLDEVLNDVASIASEKADHIESSYSDSGLANAWSEASAAIGGLAESDEIQSLNAS